MKMKILPNRDVKYLDDFFLDNQGLVKILPACDLQKIDLLDIQIWANIRGIYCIPTCELIEWLRIQINGKFAIEICSGNGAIGRALDIIRTDSYIQTDPRMKFLYESIGQKPIDPPVDVLRYEANQAVDTFSPEVVIGSYITQKYEEGDENYPKIGSSVFGVNELELYQKVQKYICIGNSISHKDKRLLKLPHQIHKFDWLFTRSTSPQENEIYIWNKSD